MGMVKMQSFADDTKRLLPPYTLWNLLDDLLIQLASEDEGVCSDRISSNRVYNALIDLICGNNIEEAVEELEISKPYYHYLLVIFYLIFRVKRLEAAYKLYRRLAREYEERRALFDPDERVSFAVIGRVVERFWALRHVPNVDEHKTVMRLHLEILAREIENMDCIEYGWGCMFKDLVAAMLTPDMRLAIEKTKSITSKLKEKLRIEPLDDEVIEGYNIFREEAIKPIYDFISSMAKKEQEKRENVEHRVREAKDKQRELETKRLKIISIVKKLQLYTENAQNLYDKIKLIWPVLGTASFLGLIYLKSLLELPYSVIVSLTPLIAYIPLLFLRYYEHKLKKIREELERLSLTKIEEISQIIWEAIKTT